MLGLNPFGLDGDGLAPRSGAGTSPGGSAPQDSGTQGFCYLRHTAAPYTYRGPWTLTVAQDMAFYPGPDDDVSGLAVSVTPDGIATLDTVITVRGLPNPLPAPFDESLAVLTLTGLVDGVLRGLVLFPDLKDGGAEAEAAASQAILAADTDLAAGPPLITLLPPGSLLPHGSDGVVHVLLTGRDASGAALDFSVFTASLAITRGMPTDADFAEADLLVRTADPAGTYARLAVGANAGRVLGRGNYFVSVRLQTGGLQIARLTRLLSAPRTLTVT